MITPGDWMLFAGLMINAGATLLVMRGVNKRVGQATVVAGLLLDEQVKTVSQNIETQSKLDQIHIDTNSNLTREMQERLVALKGQISLTKELIRISEKNKIDPDPQTQISLINLELVVKQLEMILKERETDNMKVNV